MVAATPPLRTSSSSTRKDSDTRSSLSATNWSLNVPGNTIRWSVAIDPVTAIRTCTTPVLEGSRFEVVRAVGALPRQVDVGAAEVAVGGGRRVDRAQQVQVADDRG